MCDEVTDKFEVDGGVDFTDEMVFGNEFVEGNGFQTSTDEERVL